MHQTYPLARDHLEQAATILSGTDAQTVQLRNILVRTIALMRDYEDIEREEDGNVVRFDEYWRPRRPN